ARRPEVVPGRSQLELGRRLSWVGRLDATTPSTASSPSRLWVSKLQGFACASGKRNDTKNGGFKDKRQTPWQIRALLGKMQLRYEYTEGMTSFRAAKVVKVWNRSFLLVCCRRGSC